MRSLFVIAALLVGAGVAFAQPPAVPPPHDPNAYPDFGYWPDPALIHYPEGRAWGAISALDMDRDGMSVWVFDRCESIDSGCATSNLNPVMKFDRTGKVMKEWGAGQFRYPHGIFVDKDDNVWTVDGQARSGAQGQVVRKWTQDGKLLMTLGEWGVPGTDNYHFKAVSDVLVAPDGDIFVADGHDAATNDRMLKYDSKGKFIKEWGKLGTGPGEFNPPHALAMDAQGRLYVGDRSNNRIQIFDQDGKFLAEWKQFGRPSGIFIKGDMLYVADSLSSRQNNPGFRTGIRWGHISDGKVIGFIPWGPYNTIEAVAVDDQDNIYAGFTNEPGLRKFTRD